MPQELYLQITLNENGSIATVNNLGQAIAKTGGESEGASGKVDKLSNSFDKSESTTTSLIGTLKGLGIAYAALRIERTIEGWMKLSIAQDTVDRTLKAAMISNNRYSEAFYQSTLKQAQALQRLTGEDDAVIEASQRMLMTFNSISNDTMPRATKAVLNLSVLMGAEGGGLRGATLSLGKAMEGNVEGLKRFGIVIDENVYKQKGALGVLAAVEAKVNGQAEALAQGSGQWKILGSQIDEAKEALGGYIGDVLTSTGVVSGFASALDLLTGYFKYLKDQNYERIVERENEKMRQATEEGKVYLNQMAAWVDSIAAKKTLAEQIIDPFAALNITLESTTEKINDFGGSWQNISEKAAKALEEVNDIIAKSTLTPYALEVYELDKKFKGLRETLENSPAVIKAYASALSEIKTGIGEEYWKNILEIDKISNKLIEADNKVTEEKRKNLLAVNELTNKIYADEEKREKDLLTIQIDAISSRLLAEEAAAKKIEERWKQISENIGSSFTDSFTNAIMGDKNAFRDLGKSIGKQILHGLIEQNITQPLVQNIIQPFLNQMIPGLSGNLVPANFTGPLAPGQQYAPAWMGSYGPKVLGALGAGGVGYGIGQMAGQSGIGSGFGAMAGYAIGGVPGAMALGIGGMIIEGLTGGGGADIPSPAEIARTAFAENMKSAFRDVIGQGITEGLKSGDFSSFEKSLKASLGNMVVESFKTLMISQMLTPLMDLFQPFFTTMNTISQQATGNLPSPFAGKIGQGLWAKIMPQLPPLATIADATGKLPTADMLNDVIKTTLQPIFDSVTPLIQPFIDALGLNTDATKASTATLQSYNDNVDSFLAELAGGPLAPFQSSAEMQNRYNALYSAALIDPTKFPEFSSYAGGSYLPYLQGTSPNYGGDYAGMVSQTMGFKPTWGIPSLDTASSPVINPGDYAMPTVAGQTQGPGFKQMFKEALQEVLAPMLLDIANSNREDKELTGSLEIKGNLGNLVAEAIIKDANARLAAHNA